VSFEEAIPYVAAAYAVILVAILVWAALVARRTARLRRRLEDLERGLRTGAPAVTTADGPAAPRDPAEPGARPPAQ
jgi:CcmD family protein